MLQLLTHKSHVAPHSIFNINLKLTPNRKTKKIYTLFDKSPAWIPKAFGIMQNARSIFRLTPQPPLPLNFIFFSLLPKPSFFPTGYQTCLRKIPISDSFTIGSSWNLNRMFATQFLALSPLGIMDIISELIEIFFTL